MNEIAYKTSISSEYYQHVHVLSSNAIEEIPVQMKY